MNTFIQWTSIDEDRRRTMLGLYPPEYGAGLEAPLAVTPHSADAARSYSTIHKYQLGRLLGAKKRLKK